MARGRRANRGRGRGKATKDLAEDEAAQENMADEAAQENMADEAAQEHMADEAAQEDMADEAAQEDMADEAAPEHMADEAAQEDMADEAAQEHKADEAAPEHMADEAAPEHMADEAAQEHKADEAAQEHKADEPTEGDEEELLGEDEFEADVDENEEIDDGLIEGDEGEVTEDAPAKTESKDEGSEEEVPMETQVVAQESKPEEKAVDDGNEEKAEDTSTNAPSEEKSEEKKDDKEDAKKEAKKEEAQEKTEKKRKKKERARPYELEKYWKAVRTNPADFTGWTYLLQFVEQEDHMPFYREAFDAFFDHYPYCYGYWKKYSDAERKKGSLDKCWAVFDKGLKAIPLSSDLWLHYISVSSQAIPKSDEGRAEKIRDLYEKAIASAGMDFRSDKLWDQYILFEKKDQKDWRRVMQLYDRILQVPTQLYRHHFDKLKEFIQSHIPKEYLDFDEFLNLREQVVAEAAPVEADEDEGGPPGEDAPPGEEAPPGEDAPPGIAPSSASKVIEGENKLIQEKVIESRRAVFRKTEQEVSKRWAYEEAIRRPYFHAKPLEKGQLKTWREYLEFEEANGNHDRTVLLYERCLIACALYEEFWLKYARYMEKTSSEAATAVFKRGCTTHLPSKPALNIQWAAFEEKHGNFDTAKEILEKLQEKQQDSVMIRLERINFERRRGNHEEVISLYNGCIDDAKTATGQSFFASKLARFYLKVVGDHEKAIESLQKVLDQKQVSPILREQIYTQLLDVEYQRFPVVEEKMTAIFDTVLSSGLPIDVKIQFAQRKIQFLQDFGLDPAKAHDAVEEHQKLVKTTSSGKKRGADATGDAASTPAAPNESKTPDTKKRKSSAGPSNQSGQGGMNNQGYNNSGSSGYNYNNYAYGQQGQGPQGQGQGAGNNFPNYPQNWSNWGSYFPQ